MSDLGLSTIVAIITIAILLRSTFGFGDAVFAVPLFAMFSDVVFAAPVLAAVGSVTTVIVCVRDFRQIAWRSVLTLLIGCLLGLPLGLLLLKTAPSRPMLLSIGAVTTTYAAYALFAKTRTFVMSDHWAIPVGVLSGILGGSFNMFGLPVAIYGSFRGWTPERFRILTSSFFLPTGMIAVAGHYYAGLWGEDFGRAFGFSLIPALIALEAGRLINARIDPAKFRKYVWMLILLIGLLLVIRNI
jgi:hypothetical protein